jgi:hypothetical protein
MNYARLNYASLSLVLAMGGCLLEDKSLCHQDYTEEGDTSLARDCRWDFCRRNPGDSRCADAGADGGRSDPDSGKTIDGGGGQCVRCASNSDCIGCTAAPACDPATGACVECTSANQVACAAEGEVCKAGGNECVPCNDRNDCGETAPHCSANNSCEQCVSHEDCGRWGKVCDGGQCVQCTPQTESKQCPDLDPAPGDQGPACDPVAKTCTGEPRGSVGTCGLTKDQRVVRCVSDSECATGRSCVATAFKGQPFGKYCLRQSDSCSAPWPSPIATTSVGGLEGPFCAPRELLANCEAILEFGASCSVDDDCGGEGVDDGHCESGRCTYACGGHTDCNGTSCQDFDAGRYCNPF